MRCKYKIIAKRKIRRSYFGFSVCFFGENSTRFCFYVEKCGLKKVDDRHYRLPSGGKKTESALARRSNNIIRARDINIFIYNK